MPTVRTVLAAALFALIGAYGAAVADAIRPQCQADDAIPEFVTRRIELVSTGWAGDASGGPAVELERDPSCFRGLRSEP